MKSYVRRQKDENWVPDDWLRDIGINPGGPGIDLDMTADGNKWHRVERGRLMPAGSTVEVVVIRDSAGRSAYMAFYSARWTANVSFKRVKLDEGWGRNAAPGPVSDAKGSAVLVVASGTTPEPSNSNALARMVQRELRRFGCCEKDMDGVRGGRPSRCRTTTTGMAVFGRQTEPRRRCWNGCWRRAQRPAASIDPRNSAV
ncbi:hypothetical protein RXV86_17610 [Alisedimentitalea sp. MJ-SS2]|uniref:hypothetical protein n=1 Tax=Aliisedimentitalea sp. MJ-SS2 TaxID=3049795 RepID=UPI002910C175|nr:hypothetical protein [Alisedimentitalea sp. MJ-SS2]MDU8929214.1 hypothetical protein [Alisedimentitalea sp. MJ-SS2]